ncbi:fatty-acid peroxygenase [Amorphoplanes auranticolor]|uniref:Fatty-acid peroxygenase n=2 Tax=Actinoplanes auranticolor TaxID=47988 RepID=A0A919SDB0_9ACTN|nr:fatty-acid peroxygenase [Actinoplanes auranticolor]
MHDRMANLDQTLVAGIKGYAWLPDLRRKHHDRPVPLRVLGQRAVAVCGPEAVRFFYDESHVERHTALPHPVVATLFGKNAVHTLDGAAHRHRKALFVALLMNDGIDVLAKLVGESFDEAAESWRGRSSVTLFDEAALVIARAVTRWAGIPVTDDELPKLAADLVAMVDGFATPGPRHWRALAARRRRERWLAAKIEGVRSGDVIAPADAAITTIAHYREDGEPLEPRTAAVELINILRPATAVAWFLAFSAHALDRWPQHRRPLRDGDDEFTAAFVHEVRRFYPFAPFLGGRAVEDLTFAGERIPKGALVLLDVYGQNHDNLLFPQPYEFRPERFVDRPIGEFDLIPQGGGDPRTGHRCPGEQITVALLGTLAQRLARLDYYLPPQDLSINLSRIPARPASDVEIVVP